MANWIAAQAYTKRTMPDVKAGLQGLLAFLSVEFGNVQRGIARAGSRVVTGNTTVVATDGLILVDTTTAAVTVTLPAANSVLDMLVTIKRISGGAHAVTISGTVDGAVNPTLGSQYAALTLWAYAPSTGAGTWYTVAKV